MTVPDIFLSYNREDQAVARLFAEAFGREGFEVWWDVTLRSGEAYDEVTEAALRGAKAVVVLWSPRSVVSRWVRSEATIADRCKTLVPVMIEPCERPIMFELTQTAELSHWDGDAQNRAWQAFLADVGGIVARGRAKDAPVPAPAAADRARQVASRGRPSLAIMPFTNRSGEASDEVFARGMVEDLTDALSTSDGLRVIASSASRTYADAAYDAREVGRELDARYLLEGNVRRSDDQFRVTAQLVDTRDGAVLWSQKFDRPLNDLAALQEELATEVAANVGTGLNRAEVERALRKPGNLTAWEAIVRAEVRSVMQTAEGMKEGLEDARLAAALAPDYALAHAVHARSASVYYWQVPGARTEDVRDEIVHACNKALALDADNPSILFRVAEALCIIGSWRKGLRYAERANQIAPHRDGSLQAMIMVSIYYKQADEALRYLDAYDRIAPRGIHATVRLIQRSAAHYLKGEFQRALTYSEQAMMLNPSWFIGQMNIVGLLEKLGRREEALDALAEFKELAPDMTLEIIEVIHTGSLLAPDMAREMYDTIAAVWNAAEHGGTAR
jgi:TolB-like protein